MCGTWVAASMVLLQRGGEGWIADNWVWAWVPVAAALIIGMVLQFHDAPRGPFSSPGGRFMALIAALMTAFLGGYDMYLAARPTPAPLSSLPLELMLMPARRVRA